MKLTRTTSVLRPGFSPARPTSEASGAEPRGRAHRTARGGGGLGEALASAGLHEHCIRAMPHDGDTVTAVVASGGAAGACDDAAPGAPAQCRAIKTGQPVLSSAYPRICRQFCPGDREHACLPLIVGGVTRGVVQLLLPSGEGSRSVSTCAAIETAHRYIRETTPVLQAKLLNEALQDSVVRDPLTQTHNRRFLDETGERLVALAKRRGSRVGFLMCDLDGFKQINDRHSHAAGDLVLRETAEILASTLRVSDLVIRYGGDEFLVILQDVEDETPEAIAERLRVAVDEHGFRTAGAVLHSTLSIGVAQLADDADDLASCIRLADAALYVAKSRGRNQVARYDHARPLAAAPATSATASSDARPSHAPA